MEARSDPRLIDQIRERRERLAIALRDPSAPPDLSRLLVEVDAALERVRAGTFGICETCHDPIEDDRLRTDPLIRYCLDHLDARERDALQRDLDLATAVQSALLPRRELRTDGWETHYVFRPAGPVSGDYCDVLPASSASAGLWFAVGDASGKGIAASLLSAHLNALLRALIPLSPTVDEVVDRANRLLVEGTLDAHYATLVAGRAMPGGGIELCNAGHATPLLIHAGQPSAVASHGLPLGMFASGFFPVTRFVMSPGDALILVTDGVTEARDRGGNELGLDGLAQAVQDVGATTSARELAAGLMTRIEGYTTGMPPPDDVTLLVLRRH